MIWILLTVAYLLGGAVLSGYISENDDDSDMILCMVLWPFALAAGFGGWLARRKK